MPYMVTFQGTDGNSGFHLCQDKPDALRMAEHFRNSDEVAELAVYRADEIPLEFKTYYRAEFTGDEPAAAVRMDDVVSGTPQLSEQEAAATTASPATPVDAQPEVPTLDPAPEAGMPDEGVGETEAQETTFGIFSRP